MKNDKYIIPADEYNIIICELFILKLSFVKCLNQFLLNFNNTFSLLLKILFCFVWFLIYGIFK